MSQSVNLSLEQLPSAALHGNRKDSSVSLIMLIQKQLLKQSKLVSISCEPLFDLVNNNFSISSDNCKVSKKLKIEISKNSKK